MKKILCLILTLCLLCPFGVVASKNQSSEEPIMKIGIISDLQATSSQSAGMLAAIEAFNFFKEKGVGVVINAGDIADSNSADVYSHYTSKFKEILGDIPHVAVPGNHDIWSQGSLEEYTKYFDTPNSHRVIGGFHFITIGSEGSDTNGNYYQASKDYAAAELEKAAADANGAPIFLITHQHISDTVYGSESWGNNFLWGIVDKYPNVIHFSGHSHFVLDDERSIWQGDFTAIGTSSLSYTELEYGKDNGSVPPDASEAKQYLYLEIFEDRIEIERIKAATGEKIKDTWVLSLPLSKDTFTYTDARGEGRTAPYFEEDADISLNCQDDDLVITFDAAKHEDFVHSYRIKLLNKRGTALKDILIFSDFYKGLENMSDPVTYTLKDCIKEFEAYTLSITPIESWGIEGEPLVREIVTVDSPFVPDTVRGSLFSLDFTADGVKNTSANSAATIFAKNAKIERGDIAYALVCDETSGLKLNIPSAYYTLTAKRFTLEAAFSADSLGQRQTVISCLDENGMEIFLDTEGNICFTATLDGGESLNLSAPVTATNIHHVAVALSSSEAILYLDGKAVDSADFTGNRISYNRNASFTLGKSANNSSVLYGKIYAASFSNSTLSADGVADLYTISTNLYNHEVIAPVYSELRRMQLSFDRTDNKVVRALLSNYIAELSILLTSFTLPQSTIDTVLSARDIDNTVASLRETLFDGEFTPPTVTGIENGASYDLFSAPVYLTWGNGDHATINGEESMDGAEVTDIGFNRYVVFNGTAPTIVDFRTYSSYTPPVISGVTDGKTYDLYKEAAPVISWTPAELSAMLDNAPYTAGTPVTSLGWHTLIITDSVASYVFAFKIEDSTPVVYGIENGKIYRLDKEDAPAATWNFEGSATLNGNPYEMGTPITEVGEHTLFITDGAGTDFTFVFTVITRNKGDLDGDGEITVADALAALRIAARMTEGSAEDLELGDIDADGEITVADALAILRVAARMADSL